ncbi:MAG: hypothetical protein PHV16_05005, partial [Candidatus Nanoarchaeia archaeon]|nr:hypothetical protein [Candidatus Nanoarchaeia archaeon]
MKKKAITKKISVNNLLYQLAITWFNACKIKKLEVEGKENISKGGYCIFVGNHTRLLDPLAFYSKVQKMPFLARDDFIDDISPKLGGFGPRINKKKYDVNWAVNSVLSYVFDSIPVRRKGVKPTQLKTAKRKFKEKKSIVFFPMGTRSTTGSIYDMYNSSDERTPGKLIDSLQRTIGEPAHIIPFALSYDEIINFGTVSIGNPFHIITDGVKADDKNLFYDKAVEKIMDNIGRQTKVYGDSLLAAIVTMACKDLDEKQKYILDTSILSGVFDYAVGEIIKNKEINIYNNLQEKEFRDDCLDNFIKWAEREKIIYDKESSFLNLKEIKREPERKNFPNKDV